MGSASHAHRQGGPTVKGRVYRLAVTASLLVILVEGLGAYGKWG
jgi:hypothetical protein